MLNLLNGILSRTCRRELRRLSSENPRLPVPARSPHRSPVLTWAGGDTMVIDYLDFPSYRTAGNEHLSEEEFVRRNTP